MQKKIKHSPVEEKMLTEVELELMSILWKIKEGSVSEVIERLPQGRELAYTSVSTILRILEQKKILKTRKEGRGHIYIPILQKEAYETKAVRHVVDRVFEGTPSALVSHLLKTGDLNERDLQELRELIDRKGKQA